jgi:hypothetical protein
MPKLIIALKPSPFRSASTRFLNLSVSFARGKGVSFGTFLSKNLHSGARLSSIFHSSSRSDGTRLQIMAACSAWMAFPSVHPCAE